ncbi:MAG: TatD family hydrolase [Bacteroidota bacterium]
MIDTHAHLYAKEFDEDRNEMIQRARLAGVQRVYLPAIDSATHPALLELCRTHPDFCHPMMGLHPCHVDDDFTTELSIAREYLETEQCCAIGEIGLDYYHSTEWKQQQIEAFALQIEWGLEKDLPIVIHSRSSLEECIALVNEVGKGLSRGIFHCFGGDLRQAERVIAMGFHLGIGGVVTYKNAGMVKVVADIPLTSIVLETDAPYLTPVPFRGKRNESSYVQYVAEKIAEIKGISSEEVRSVTSDTAKKIFRV